MHHGIPAVLHRDVPWLHRHSENGALNNRGHEPVQHGSSRISKVVHGAATIVTRFIKVNHGSSNRDEPAL